MPVVFTSRLPQIAAALEPKAAAVVAKTVFAIQADATSLAPVDTGALQNSIQGQANGLSGEVSTGVNYAIYQEYGTRFMGAQPFMVPAAEQNRGPFMAGMRGIVG